MRNTVHFPAGTSQVSFPSLVHMAADIENLIAADGHGGRQRRLAGRNFVIALKAIDAAIGRFLRNVLNPQIRMQFHFAQRNAFRKNSA